MIRDLLSPFRRHVGAAGAAAAALLLVTAAGAAAQEASGAAAVDAPRVVTRAELKALTAATPERAPTRTEPVAALPTIDPDEYAAAKAAAAAPDPAGKPTDENGGRAPSLLNPPVVKQIQYDGVGMVAAGNLTPPDTHGAVGMNHYCQVVNSYIKCYQKGGTNAVVLASSLAAFTGYNAQLLFDPRIVYDSLWNRWVLAVAAREESPGVLKLFLAVSQGANPAKPWWIYTFYVNWSATAGGLWDYNGLGLDQDAVILTANWFVNNSYVDSRLLMAAKARLYNGLGLTYYYYTGLVGTLQPPIVLDNDQSTYVVGATDGAAGAITKYTLKHTSRSGPSLAGSTITVPAYAIPPDAPQPGSSYKLDTLDARFQNASTQNGGMLWQTHAINFAGYAVPKWYKLNCQTDAVAASGMFYVFPSSYDWNPSIAANAAGDVFVNWSMTCPVAGPGCPNGALTVRARFSGKLAADASINGNPPGGGGFGNSGANVYEQGNGVDPARFGDYSAVSIDPTNSSLAWITNEVITPGNTWGSRIARIGF